MPLRSMLDLLGLSLVWGLAFLFIRVAVPVLGPPLLVELRVLVAGLVLWAWVRMLGLHLGTVRDWPRFMMLGLLNSALPFLLVSYAELRVEASLAAVLVATTPLFSAVLAHLVGEERMDARKATGLTVGIAGVAILAGWSPGSRSVDDWLALAALVGAAMVYACAGVYSRRRGAGTPPAVLAAGSQLGAAVLMLPLVEGHWPAALAGATPAALLQAPLAGALLCALALALLSSALAFVLYFRLIAAVGPVRTLTVNFLSPAVGVAGGVLLLGEPLTPAIVLGLAVVLAGTWLVLVRPSR